jgi:hypothetical protein
VHERLAAYPDHINATGATRAKPRNAWVLILKAKKLPEKCKKVIATPKKPSYRRASGRATALPETTKVGT